MSWDEKVQSIAKTTSTTDSGTTQEKTFLLFLLGFTTLTQ